MQPAPGPELPPGPAQGVANCGQCGTHLVTGAGYNYVRALGAFDLAAPATQGPADGLTHSGYWCCAGCNSVYRPARPATEEYSPTPADLKEWTRLQRVFSDEGAGSCWADEGVFACRLPPLADSG